MPDKYRSRFRPLGLSGTPRCPYCGQPMVPSDDHGNYACFCQGLKYFGSDSVELRTPRIRQVDTAGMTNAQKAKVDPIHRLHSAPTAAEQKLLDLMLKGPGAMDDPEYTKALEDVAKERGGG